MLKRWVFTVSLTDGFTWVSGTVHWGTDHCEGFIWVSVRDSSLKNSSLRVSLECQWGTVHWGTVHWGALQCHQKTFKFEHFPHRFQWKYWCFDMIFLSFFDFGSIEVKVWWKFAWNFHESFMKLSWKFHSDMKVWWNFHETFKALWKFDETFMKLSRHYETFMKLSSCYESFMKVWWNFHETFMQTFIPQWNFHESFMKLSHANFKISMKLSSFYSKKIFLSSFCFQNI